MIGIRLNGLRGVRRLSVTFLSVLTSSHVILNVVTAEERPAPLSELHSTKSVSSPRTLESAEARTRLPLYQTIPAAKDSELTSAAETSDPHRVWARSHGDQANTRYSSLSQIDRGNVSRLEVAWIYHSKDGKGNIQANPVIVDGVMYAPTVGKSIVAVNATTGEELWKFHPPGAGEGFLGFGPAQRGLVYWPGDLSAGKPSVPPRLFLPSGTHLYALDPRTGAPIATFGKGGRVPSQGVVAPTLFHHILVVPNLNIIDAFDVVTGAPLWKFALTDAAEHRWKPAAEPNCWAGMAMDAVRGIAYIQVGDPHRVGGADYGRLTRDAHVNSILALDARTGRLLWSFQEIAHDIWDLDVSAPPNLVTVTQNGKRIDAVAQVTKHGNTLLLDRVTGKPLFPFRLRRAPVSKLPGGRTWPYQPDVQLPEPFARQIFTRDDVTDISPAAREFVRQQVDQANFGWFEPYEEDKPTIFYGIHGGAEWTGAAFDPTSGWLYVSANNIPYLVEVSKAKPRVQRDPGVPPTPGEKVFHLYCSGCHGKDRQGLGMAPSLIGVGSRLMEFEIIELLQTGRDAMPPISIVGNDREKLIDFLLERDAVKLQGSAPSKLQRNAPPPYVTSKFTKLFDDRGYPGVKPPWGTLNALDLNTGKLMWKVPLGEYEELIRQGIPKTGTENFGGATVTAGGLVFCAGTRDLKIRAFDKANGQELWQYKLPFGGYAPPSTYEVDGRQYVVIAAMGGGKLGGNRGDAYVAFALPK